MSTGLLPAGLLAETPPPRMNSMRARIHTMDSILESPGDQDDFFLPRSADDLDVDSEVAALTPGSGRRSARPTPSSGSLMMDKDAPALNEGALRDWTELDPDWTVIRNLDTGDRHVCKAENIMSVIGSKVDRTVSPSELKKQDGGLMNMDSLQVKNLDTGEQFSLADVDVKVRRGNGPSILVDGDIFAANDSSFAAGGGAGAGGGSGASSDDYTSPDAGGGGDDYNHHYVAGSPRPLPSLFDSFQGGQKDCSLRLRRWQPDSKRVSCKQCKTKFGLIERRHHCRVCGGIFCAKCTRQKTSVPQIGYSWPVRLCRMCYSGVVQGLVKETLRVPIQGQLFGGRSPSASFSSAPPGSSAMALGGPSMISSATMQFKDFEVEDEIKSGDGEFSALRRVRLVKDGSFAVQSPSDMLATGELQEQQYVIRTIPSSQLGDSQKYLITCTPSVSGGTTPRSGSTTPGPPEMCDGPNSAFGGPGESGGGGEGGGAARQEIMDERSFLELVQHPNVVGVWASFIEDAHLHLVMDYVGRGNLDQVQRSLGVLTEEQTCFYASQIVMALDHLHKFDVVFRDLRPEKILIDDTGHVVLSDCGLCSTLKDGGPAGNVSVMDPEKILFLAPEVVRRADFRKEADWWSLGVNMYLMMCGHTPFVTPAGSRFSAPNRAAMETLVLTHDIQYPTWLSGKAKNILTSLLNRDPFQRLGAGANAGGEIRSHPFFAKVNFNQMLERKIPAPLGWAPSSFRPNFRLSHSPSLLQKFASRGASPSIMQKKLTES